MKKLLLAATVIAGIYGLPKLSQLGAEQVGTLRIETDYNQVENYDILKSNNSLMFTGTLGTWQKYVAVDRDDNGLYDSFSKHSIMPMPKGWTTMPPQDISRESLPDAIRQYLN